MQLNTQRSLELGRKVRETFGSWKNVKEAATHQGGIYVLDRAAIRQAKSRVKMQRKSA